MKQKPSDDSIPLDCRAPDRFWMPTRIDIDGRQLWGSREWESGERDEYARTVLRKPKPRD
jgi:hypothetical protein